jgi:hypothetical protein
MRNDSGGVGIFPVEFRDNPRNRFVVGSDTPSRHVECRPRSARSYGRLKSS